MLFGQGASQATGGAWLTGGIVDESVGGERMGVLRSGGDGACSSRTWGGAKADAAGCGDGLRGELGAHDAQAASAGKRARIEACARNGGEQADAVKRNCLERPDASAWIRRPEASSFFFLSRRDRLTDDIVQSNNRGSIRP